MTIGERCVATVGLKSMSDKYNNVINDVDGCGGGDPFTSMYSRINPVRFATSTRLTYLHHTNRI